MSAFAPSTSFLPTSADTRSAFCGKFPLKNARSVSVHPYVKITSQWTDVSASTPQATTPINARENGRIQEAFNVRVNAANEMRNRPSEDHIANGEENAFPNLIASFTKGLRHNDDSSIAKPADFQQFVDASNTGDVNNIADQPLGPTRINGVLQWRSVAAQTGGKNGGPIEVRGWESQGAGLAFDLEGPDAQQCSMPPVPLITGDEVAGEMAELYNMALLRDIPISSFDTSPEIGTAISELNNLPWFATASSPSDSPAAAERRRGPLTRDNIFRGILPGSLVGPYLSQFIIQGSTSINGETGPDSGLVQYGTITIDQRTIIAKKGLDYMTNVPFFLDVQDGGDLRGLEEYESGTRFITTMRDLATWVHFDALYEAYLNACILMLASDFPICPNLPFVGPDKVDKQEGFVLYGGPHILTLVTEVATRALKAVRYSKFNIHRRARPEAVGGLIHFNKTQGKFSEINGLVSALEPTLKRVVAHNSQFVGQFGETNSTDPSYLLPMAFTEGSPMHPSYGSGHATVAGACVTILKAFFDEDYVLPNVFEVGKDGKGLVRRKAELTVRGELEKLADNISIGRDAAGVHWFSDQYESLLLGEKIAIGLLQETQLTLRENFQFKLTKFDGNVMFI